MSIPASQWPMQTQQGQADFTAQHAHPAALPFFDLTLYVPGGVYHPWPQSSTHFIVTRLPAIRDSQILDLGCGSGAIGLILADPGLHNTVVLSDMDPVACATAQVNAMVNDRFARVVLSNLFDSLAPDQRFDAIVFNAPLLVDAPPGLDHPMGVDPGGRITARFLDELRDHLAPDGRAWLLWGGEYGPDVPGMCAALGLSMCTLATDRRPSGVVLHLLEIKP